MKTKEITTPDAKANQTSNLNFAEMDALKHALSLVSVAELEDTFNIPRNPEKLKLFNSSLQNIIDMQPFKARVPPFGILYRGRPDFMTDQLLAELKKESGQFKSSAWPIYPNDHTQYLYRPDTADSSTVAEQLGASAEVHKLVEKYAGKVLKSYITNYIYYYKEGHCSTPHVDNVFTSVTAMIGVEHDFSNSRHSKSVCYWPHLGRYDYQLAPGEISIFFGVCTLHGRTPLVEDENITSLLLSYRPI